MRRLVYLASARRDLVDIFEYIALQSGSVLVGRRFVQQLREQCRKLASLPGRLVRVRPELRDDVRSFPYKSYVIFFRYVGDDVEIINVLEGHRDMDAHFGRDDE